MTTRSPGHRGMQNRDDDSALVASSTGEGVPDRRKDPRTGRGRSRRLPARQVSERGSALTLGHAPVLRPARSCPQLDPRSPVASGRPEDLPTILMSWLRIDRCRLSPGLGDRERGHARQRLPPICNATLVQGTSPRLLHVCLVPRCTNEQPKPRRRAVDFVASSSGAATIALLDLQAVGVMPLRACSAPSRWRDEGCSCVPSARGSIHRDLPAPSAGQGRRHLEGVWLAQLATATRSR